MHEKFVRQGEIIFKKNEMCNTLFLLVKGKLQIIQESKISKKSMVMGNIQEGRFFAVNSFLAQKQYEFSTKCSTDCHLIYCLKEDFESVIKQRVQDYENACNIKDQILFNKRDFFSGVECQSCNQQNHTIENCRFLHLIPNKQHLIYKNNFSKDNERNFEKVRNRNKKQLFSAFKFFKLNATDLKKYRIDLIQQYYNHYFSEIQIQELMNPILSHKDFFSLLPTIKYNQLRTNDNFQEHQKQEFGQNWEEHINDIYDEGEDEEQISTSSSSQYSDDEYNGETSDSGQKSLIENSYAVPEQDQIDEVEGEHDEEEHNQKKKQKKRSLKKQKKDSLGEKIDDHIFFFNSDEESKIGKQRNSHNNHTKKFKRQSKFDQINKRTSIEMITDQQLKSENILENNDLQVSHSQLSIQKDVKVVNNNNINNNNNSDTNKIRSDSVKNSEKDEQLTLLFQEDQSQQNQSLQDLFAFDRDDLPLMFKEKSAKKIQQKQKTIQHTRRLTHLFTQNITDGNMTDTKLKLLGQINYNLQKKSEQVTNSIKKKSMAFSPQHNNRINRESVNFNNRSFQHNQKAKTSIFGTLNMTAQHKNNNKVDITQDIQDKKREYQPQNQQKNNILTPVDIRKNIKLGTQIEKIPLYDSNHFRYSQQPDNKKTLYQQIQNHNLNNMQQNTMPLSNTTLQENSNIMNNNNYFFKKNNSNTSNNIQNQNISQEQQFINRISQFLLKNQSSGQNQGSIQQFIQGLGIGQSSGSGIQNSTIQGDANQDLQQILKLYTNGNTGQLEDKGQQEYLNELYFFNFDVIKEYKYYFTSGNLTEVLQKYNQNLQKNQDQLLKKNKSKILNFIKKKKTNNQNISRLVPQLENSINLSPVKIQKIQN